MTTYTKDEIQQHRRQWAEALRSGEFQQGAGYLNKEGKYCCLGVACELMEIPTRVSGTVTLYHFTDPDLGATFAETFPGLGSVEQWAGVTRKQMWELANLNDTGKSFETIAKKIEALV